MLSPPQIIGFWPYHLAVYGQGLEGRKRMNVRLGLCEVKRFGVRLCGFFHGCLWSVKAAAHYTVSEAVRAWRHFKAAGHRLTLTQSSQDVPAV